MRSIPRRGLAFLAWSLVFAILYAQSPLYTSNQHQYFLHGLARAGYGYLAHDWLANTLDPTPVFSLLIWLTYSLFRSGWPFYVWYALLMGVYLFSTYHLMDGLFSLRRSRTRTLLFLALFFLFHSAALRYTLSQLFGSQATFLFEGGMAGQRLLGQVFQPSTFGVFLVLSLYLFLNQREWPALLPLGIAIYIHPTYLLSGAMLTSAYLIMLYRQSRSHKLPLRFGLVALAIALPVVAYVFWAFGSASSAVARQAQEILVRVRIPTHTLVSAWFDWSTAIQLGLILLALLLVRRHRLFLPFLVLTAEAALLTLAQVATGSQTLALLFPWRISVLLVPLSTSLILGWLVSRPLPFGLSRPLIARLCRLGAQILMFGLMLTGMARFALEQQRQQADPARPVLEYIAAHTQQGDLYLTPLHMEEFRLTTGAPILADFKSIPYRPEEVLEWYRRVRLIDWFYHTKNQCDFLPDLQAEGITHIVLPAKLTARACPSFHILYQDASYTLYQVQP